MSTMSTMPSSGGGSSRTITIHTTNMLRFDPMSISVPTGKVTIKLVDDGSYPHNLLIPSLKTKSKTVTGDLGGSSTTFTVTFPHPGAYPFECTYHDSAGMKGVFHVTG
ncbi:MAG: cupredoxin domain-containing protein [Gordonia polyisoprenivorans]|nr:cupredoxin domain-containing protein [Gordonia polyisoprenivorans]